MSKCCVIGLGYIGLPTAALLASSGHDVIGVDINKKVVEAVNKGSIHIVEPYLEEVVYKAVKEEKLCSVENVVSADIFIIAVPTPFKEIQEKIPSPNIDFVLSAAESIAKVIKPGNLVLLESTSPVGTTERVVKIIEEKAGINKNEFYAAYCPERVLPGQILKELKTNNRVIGGISEKDSKIAKKFYSTFCEAEIFLTNARTAELVKLTENSYRDVNIAFANELSMISDSLDINPRELINLCNHHPRVNILNPSCGVGGHCIAVDPWFIVSAVPELSKLIKTARNVNDSKVKWVINKIEIQLNELNQELLRSPKVGIMGLAYKPDVDDLRESSALIIAKKLISKGYEVTACEPNLNNYSEIKLYAQEEIINHVDVLIFLVAHKPFKRMDISNKKFMDFCGIFQK